MSEKRTEEQIITQAPIMVSFGGKKYELKLLVIKESREWRRQFAAVLGGLPLFVNAIDTTEHFQQVINGMFLDVPDKVVDLIFAYAKDLPRDEIEAVATDVEMSVAFERIIEVAFPLSRSMMGATAKLSQ